VKALLTINTDVFIKYSELILFPLFLFWTWEVEELLHISCKDCWSIGLVSILKVAAAYNRELCRFFVGAPV